MEKVCHTKSRDLWKNIKFSSIFTRSNFEKLLKNDDFSTIQSVISDYEQNHVGTLFNTYSDFILYAYKYLLKNYRNEYVYKNTLINSIIKNYGTENSVIFNEFAVGNSIADMVFFNGISRAFEIKTELDSNKRLSSQLTDYKKIFQQCYIVVHESCVDKYIDSDPNTGVISLSVNRGHAKLTTIKEATDNFNIDPNMLIRCIRTNEYKEIVRRFCGYLPEMSAFTAFNVCESIMETIPSEILNKLFIEVMKERKTNMLNLGNFDKSLRQICLSLHLSIKEYNNIYQKLLTSIQL